MELRKPRGGEWKREGAKPSNLRALQAPSKASLVSLLSPSFFLFYI